VEKATAGAAAVERHRKVSSALRATWVLLALAAVGLSAVPAAATGPPVVTFQKLDVNRGLSHNTVTAIAQDRQGFLWLGTRDGLNRYDGQRVRTFLHDPEDPTSLSGSHVSALRAAADGRLWVSTFEGGLDVFDPVTETFSRHPLGTPAEMAKSEDSEEAPLISSLLEDRQGRLWVGTDQGLWLQDSATKRWAVFRHVDGDPASLSHDRVMSLYQDPEGTLWIGTFGGGLNRRDPDEEGFRAYRHDPGDPASLSSDLVQTVYRDSRGTLWVGTAGAGLNRLQLDASQSEGAVGEGLTFERWRHDADDPGSLSSDYIYGLQEDDGGHLWIATYGGGLERRSADGELVNFQHNPRNPLDPSSLPENFLLTLFRDRSGTFWVGTDEGGAVSFHRNRDRFTHHFNDLIGPAGLSHNTVWSFYQEPNGTLWIGTSNGLNRLDPESYEFTRIESPGGTNAQMVRSLLGDASEGGGETTRLWLGTLADGLQRLDVTDGRVEETSVLRSQRVRALVADGSGGLWLGTQGGGLLHLPGNGEPVFAYGHAPENPRSLSHNIVTSLARDAESGALWVGTQSGGLSRLDPSTGQFQQFTHDPEDPGSLASDEVHHLLTGSQDRLWISTGRGLDQWSREGQAIEHYGQAEGLPEGAVFCAQEDAQGRLWVSTESGISRLDPSTGKVRNFDSREDLHNNRFLGGSCYRGPSGTLFFGGVYGFHSFQPDEIRDNPQVPPIAVPSVLVFNQPIPRKDLPPSTRRLRLSHRENFLTFEMAALHYANPRRNQYSYRLKGFDREWIDGGDEPRAVYSNLPPGRYVFQARGSNNDGLWNLDGASVPITISPPVWSSWWAYSLYSALGVGAILLLLRAQGQRVRRRSEDLRKTEELERARALQLSMLPKQPPQRPDLDIAVHMQTATEVGGDYYDFFPQEDGSLFIAYGDATGHGISAGMMVSMTKIALRSLDVREPARILDRLSRILREIHPSGLRMALGLARVGPGEIELASAAMPPALLYRPESNSVEEILLPALPLGGNLVAPYPSRAVSFEPGDTLVLISDGLPERRNGLEECLGYRMVEECLARYGGGSAHQVLEELVQLGEEWAGGQPPQDDITILVIRRLEPEESIDPGWPRSSPTKPNSGDGNP
jgi:ligand-binding sensor domain-containing protein